MPDAAFCGRTAHAAGLRYTRGRREGYCSSHGRRAISARMQNLPRSHQGTSALAQHVVDAEGRQRLGASYEDQVSLTVVTEFCVYRS